jgi:hypothetical protein
MVYIEQLFHKVVDITSTSAKDIIADLEYIRNRVEDTGHNDEEITELYKYLDKAHFSTPKLRRVFCLTYLFLKYGKLTISVTGQYSVRNLSLW